MKLEFNVADIIKDLKCIKTYLEQEKVDRE